MARRALPSPFATIGKIFSPGTRNADHPAAQSAQTKVVYGDYFAALASSMLSSPGRARPWPIERAVHEAFERVVWVSRSVETIAGQQARLPFVLKQDDDKVDDHPLLVLLNKRANPMETGRQFRSRLGKQLLLSKRGAFVQVTRARNDTPVRLDLLPPGRTQPVPGSAMTVDQDGRPTFNLIDHYEVVRSDGSRAFIPADEVIWFREPHPIDPYSGTTPLEAAGMSVELDYFTRLYNTSFLKNDGRPGGIIGIAGDLEPEEMDRIEDKFGHGPVEAGKLTVIAGDVSYVDSAVRPRDMQYGQLSSTSRDEVLAAFGIPLTMLGDSSGRTFDNAGQDGFNFWTITMPTWLDLIVTGFAELSEDEFDGEFDVSKVPALAAAEAAKREEARSEQAAGLISIDEYREATGKDAYGVPATRALIVGNGTTMIPTTEADQKALGGPLVPLGQAAAPAGGDPRALPAAGERPAIGASSSHPAPGHRDTGPTADDDQAGNTGGQQGKPAPGGQAAGPANAPEAKAAPVPAPRRAPDIILPATAPRRVIGAVQVKAAPRQTATQPSGNGQGDQDEGDDDRDAADQQAGKLETALAAALAGVAAGWAASSRPPDPAAWSRDAASAVAPLLAPAALEAATRSARDAGSRSAPSVTSDGQAPEPPEQTAATSATSTVTSMVRDAASGLALRLALAVAAGETVSVAHEAAVWAAGVAVHAATALVNDAADAAATLVSALTGRTLVRVWRTKKDTRVRESHELAEGQRQLPGVPFIVGGYPLMYPGDPAAPLELVAGCRCRLSHRAGRPSFTA